MYSCVMAKIGTLLPDATQKVEVEYTMDVRKRRGAGARRTGGARGRGGRGEARGGARTRPGSCTSILEMFSGVLCVQCVLFCCVVVLCVVV